MKPEYVVKKSIIPAFKLIRVLLIWLIVPAIIILVDALKRKCDRYEFYNNGVVHRWGVIAKHEEQIPRIAILAVNVNQSVMGRIFNYGDVYIDAAGGTRWDIDTKGIKSPKKLRKYLQSSMMNGRNMHYYTNTL